MRAWTCVAAFLFLFMLAGCGGSTGNSDIGSVTAVKVTCNPTTITSGQTSQCTASLTCTGKACYNVPTWSATVGTIDINGLFTAPPTDVTLQVNISANVAGVLGSAVVIVNP